MAESCTGGWISQIITARPGASEFYLGCAVTYSNEAKENILGVSHETLLAHGAVSEETAKEMALGSKKVFGSDIAAPHHSERFDFDEAVLPLALDVLTTLSMELGR